MICLLSILNINSKMFFCSIMLFFIQFLLNNAFISQVKYHRISSGFFLNVLFIYSCRFFGKLIQLSMHVILKIINVKMIIFMWVFGVKIDDKVNNIRSKIFDFIKLLSYSNWW